MSTMLREGYHNSDAFVGFVGFFCNAVVPDQFAMLPRRDANQLDIAGWAQRYVQSRGYGYGLDMHQEPATIFGLDAKAYYNLVMGRGENYAIDLVAFDQLSAAVRKEIANSAVCGVSGCGTVPWFSALREQISAVDAAQMVFWRTAI